MALRAMDGKWRASFSCWRASKTPLTSPYDHPEKGNKNSLRNLPKASKNHEPEAWWKGQARSRWESRDSHMFSPIITNTYQYHPIPIPGFDTYQDHPVTGCSRWTTLYTILRDLHWMVQIYFLRSWSKSFWSVKGASLPEVSVRTSD